MEKTIKIVSLKKPPSDYQYWISKPISERLDAIEILRQQYLELNRHAHQGLQRVCRIIKQT